MSQETILTKVKKTLQGWDTVKCNMNQ